MSSIVGSLRLNFSKALSISLTSSILKEYRLHFLGYSLIRSCLFFFDLIIIFLIARFVFIVFNGDSISSGVIDLQTFGIQATFEIEDVLILLVILIVIRPLATILSDVWLLQFLGNLELKYSKSQISKQLESYSSQLSTEELGKIVHILTYGPAMTFVRLISDQIRLLTELFGLTIILLASVLFSPLSSIVVFIFYVSIFVAITIRFGKAFNRHAESYRNTLMSAESQLLQIQTFLPDLKILPLRWRLLEDLLAERRLATQSLSRMMSLEAAPRLLIESFSYLFLLSLGTLFLIIDGQALINVTFTFLLIGRLVPILLNILNHINSIRVSRPIASLLHNQCGIYTPNEDVLPLKTNTSPFASANLRINRLDYEIQEVKIFKELSLSVNADSFTAIYGPSGSGKSTLGRLCLGLIEAPGNSIKIGALTPDEINKANPGFNFFVPSTPFLLPQNLYVNLSLQMQLDDGAYTKLNGIVNRLGLEHLLEVDLDLASRSLSQGEKQRIAIGRWLFSNSRFVVFDEPTSFLDSENAEVVRKILLEKRDCTRIVLTHDLEFKDMVDHAYAIKNGVLVPIK